MGKNAGTRGGVLTVQGVWRVRGFGVYRCTVLWPQVPPPDATHVAGWHSVYLITSCVTKNRDEPRTNGNAFLSCWHALYLMNN
eukprot:1158657-Pelagomonas_calceolata.AAC.3